MKEIGITVPLGLLGTPAAAQSELCWRDPYPRIPGEWSGSGSVIESGNRFRFVIGSPWSCGHDAPSPYSGFG